LTRQLFGVIIILMKQKNKPENNMNKTALLAKYILELIDEEGLKTGDAIPSLRKLSKTQGTSTFVAKKAVEFLAERDVLEAKWGYGIYIKKYSSELKENILQALTEKKTASAASRSNCSMNLIAFIAKGRHADFFGDYLPGFSDVLKRENYHYILEQSNNSFLCEEDEVQSLLHSNSVKGFIIDAVIKNKAPNYLRDLRRMNMPAVFVGDTYFGKDIEVDRVLCDNNKGMSDIVEYVISMGHKRIAYIGTPEPRLYVNQLRHSIYADVMNKHGLTPFAMPAFSEDAMKENIEELRKTQAIQKDRITAFVCCGDAIANNCIKALKHLGLNVPDDVSVTGFDNRRWTEYSYPAITTVHYPCQEVGARAAELLLQKINGAKPVNDCMTCLEQPRLIIRGSVAECKRD